MPPTSLFASTLTYSTLCFATPAVSALQLGSLKSLFRHATQHVALTPRPLSSSRSRAREPARFADFCTAAVAWSKKKKSMTDVDSHTTDQEAPASFFVDPVSLQARASRRSPAVPNPDTLPGLPTHIFGPPMPHNLVPTKFLHLFRLAVRHLAQFRRHSQHKQQAVVAKRPAAAPAFAHWLPHLGHLKRQGPRDHWQRPVVQRV